MFNEMSKQCDLTVLYERENSDSRDRKWSSAEKALYKKVCLNGIKTGTENSFSLKALKYVFGSYDTIIIGCYNSPLQMLIILLLRFLGKAYVLNVDGEPFANGKGIKNIVKRFFIRGATKYLVAGEKSAESISKIEKNAEIYPYYFSSLSESELIQNASAETKREDFVLVVGQYLDVKGLDIALEAAKMDQSVKYKFVGMGKGTEEFIERFDAEKVENVEFIPFLQKEDLYVQYRKCAAFILPSRQECWGLVINEAASFGTPIVSTSGSGAAIEFLSADYPQFLAKAGNAESLYNCLINLLETNNEEYSNFLKEKSKNYSIEKNSQIHLDVI